MQHDADIAMCHSFIVSCLGAEGYLRYMVPS